MNINQKCPAWLTNILSFVIAYLGIFVSLKDEILGLATIVGFDIHLVIITKVFSIAGAVLATVKLFFGKIAETFLKSDK